MKKIKKEKKPFFSRFLETQKLEEPKNLKGGRRHITMKYPSDSDDDGVFT